MSPSYERKNKQRVSNNSPKISIIICTRNRVDETVRCIDSILPQTLPPDEIIVVDASDSDDLKLEIENHFGSENTITYIRSEPGLTRQRNVGVKASSGDVAFFFDDDVTLEKDYLEQTVRLFKDDENKRIGGICGLQNPRQEKFSLKRIFYQIFATIFFLGRRGNGKFQPSGFPTYPRGSTMIREVECIPGGLAAYRREVLNEFAFDEDISGAFYLEDDDFSYRVSRKYKNLYNPRSVLTHHISPVSRKSSYAKMKGWVESLHYRHKKDPHKTIWRAFALRWAIVGLVIMGILQGNRDWVRGIRDGLASVRKERTANR